MHDRMNDPAVSAEARGAESPGTAAVSIAQLYAMADQLGFTVASVTLPPGLLGGSANGRIYLQPELAGAQLRSTLAHEIVHCQLGHPHAPRAGVIAWREAGAWMDGLIDALAASMLFTDEQFTRAAALLGGSPSADVAAALGVDRKMLSTWHAVRSALLPTEANR